MSRGRTLISLEFVAQDGVRMSLDDDGWHLLHPRQMGEAQLQKARELLEKAQETLPPPAEDGKPPGLFELGDYAANMLKLRCTQRKFRQRR